MPLVPMIEGTHPEPSAIASPRISMRGIVAHVLAALAYGTMALAAAGVLLIANRHTEKTPSGSVSYVEFGGIRSNPEAIGLFAFAICIGLPFVASLCVALTRPIVALERGEAMIVHFLVLIFALFSLFLLLLFFATAGFAGT